MEYTNNDYKIQAWLDTIKEFFPFEINGKPLETKLVQGGMGVDISTFDLAKTCSDIGMMGTISTTASNYINKLKEQIEELDMSAYSGILGFNNLRPTTGYNKNYELGKELKMDFMAIAAGLAPDSIRNAMNQKATESSQYLNTLIISTMKQAKRLFGWNVGIGILETAEAGGHNGNGSTLEETIDEYREKTKSGELEPNGNKLIFAGGVRTPKDYLNAISAGFGGVQLGTLLLLAKETNISDIYRKLIINSKPGDVGDIPSPAGLPAKGFKTAGIIKRALEGIITPKKCIKPSGRECLSDCSKIQYSADAIGMTDPVGDYCIKEKLDNLHNSNANPDDCLYFCGARPEDLFIIPYMKKNNLSSLPVKEIIKQLLTGVFDIGLTTNYLTKEQKDFMGETYNNYCNKEPNNLPGKIFNN